MMRIVSTWRAQDSSKLGYNGNKGGLGLRLIARSDWKVPPSPVYGYPLGKLSDREKMFENRSVKICRPVQDKLFMYFHKKVCCYLVTRHLYFLQWKCNICYSGWRCAGLFGVRVCVHVIHTSNRYGQVLQCSVFQMLQVKCDERVRKREKEK